MWEDPLKITTNPVLETKLSRKIPDTNKIVPPATKISSELSRDTKKQRKPFKNYTKSGAEDTDTETKGSNVNKTI